MKPIAKALALATAVFGLVVGVPAIRGPKSKPRPPAAIGVADDREPSAAARELAQLEPAIAAAQRHAKRTRDWGNLEAVAMLQLSKARITHQLDDYQAVESTVEAAFARSTDGFGPLLVRAYWNYELHRLDAASADLDRLATALFFLPGQQEQSKALAADIAFVRGDYVQAQRAFGELDRNSPTASSAFRLGLYAWKTGDLDGADRLLLVGQERSTADPRMWAWLEVQRGQLAAERGQYQRALEHFERADQRFSGWWYVRSQRAGALARTQAVDAAVLAYQEVVDASSDPEAMDALAGLLAAADPARASELTARAKAEHRRWMETYPEAAIGHAVGRELAQGDPASAVELAERNVELRPGGDAQLLLTQALFAAGRCADSRQRLEKMLATPYRTVWLHATAALVFEQCGSADQAASHRAQAQAVHPNALGELAHLRPQR